MFVVLKNCFCKLSGKF